MPTVTLPTGETATFPDTMSAEEIKAVLSQKFPSPTIDSRIATSAGVGPTRRQIPVNDSTMNRTVRAAGAYLPGGDYVAGAGEYVQDRLPRALGGTARGQERTWQESLDDARATRAESAAAEPLAALGGAVLGTKNLPWAKGSGVVPLLKRALQSGGLTAATEFTQGKDLEEAATSGAESVGLSAGLESVLKTPGLVRSLGRRFNKAATHAGWRAAEATPAQAQAIAESLDPAGISGADRAGEFMKNARLANGEFVVGGSPEDTYRRLTQFIEEWGAKKGDLVRKVEAAGGTVDAAGVMDEVRQMINELDTKEIRAVYPDIKKGLDEFAARMQEEYGPKGKVLLGWGQAGSGAHALSPQGQTMTTPPPGAPTLGPTVRRPRGDPATPVPTRLNPGVHPGSNESGLMPPTQTEFTPIRDIPEPSAAPHSMADVEEGLPAIRTPEVEAYVERTGAPGQFPSRLIPGTNTPNPNSGWAPWFQEPPPPASFAEWERLKTTLQTLVQDTKSGLNRSTDAISASPVLDRLRAISSKIKSADEAAAQRVLTPDDFAAFMEAKRTFGTASELDPLFRGALRNAETSGGMTPVQESRRLGHMLPWAMGISGSAPGIAMGNPAAMLLGAATGYGAGKTAEIMTHSHPRMTRVYDALGRNLSRAQGPIPQVTPPDETAALIAFLRSQQETP